MRFLLRWLIRPYMYFQYHFGKLTQTGAFGKDGGRYIKTPYQPTGNLVKDGLHRHHVKQFHESSCSVASVASVINTLLEKSGRYKEDDPVTQQDLLNTVRAAHWKERMSSGGYKGKRGLPLSTLGRVVRASLDDYDIPYKSLDIVRCYQDRSRSKLLKRDLKSRMSRFDKNGDCLLIAHFDQGSFLPEFHIPHISPVGAFDLAAGIVKVLDVDSTQPYPYQVSFDVFYKGLSHNYNFMFRKYGYGEGGYIFIQL